MSVLVQAVFVLVEMWSVRRKQKTSKLCHEKRFETLCFASLPCRWCLPRCLQLPQRLHELIKPTRRAELSSLWPCLQSSQPPQPADGSALGFTLSWRYASTPFYVLAFRKNSHVCWSCKQSLVILSQMIRWDGRSVDQDKDQSQLDSDW